MRLTTEHASTVKVTVARRDCKRGKCRWRTVTSRTAAVRSAKVTVRLRVAGKGRRPQTGRYRVTVTVTGDGGRTCAGKLLTIRR